MALKNSKIRSRARSASLLKLALITASATLNLSVTGCGSMQVAQNSWNYNSAWNGFVMKHRNQGMAAKAWHRRKHGFCNETHLDEFCDGFKAGYLSVAEGSDACTPAFAPRQYWGWEYQTGEGQKKVSSWFSGYPHGCRAAEEDGIGNWTQIQTGYGIQKEYHQAGHLAANQQPGMYPMPEAIPVAQSLMQKNTSPLPQEPLLLNGASPSDAAGPEAVPAQQVPAVEVPNIQTPAVDGTRPIGIPDQSAIPGLNSRLVR